MEFKNGDKVTCKIKEFHIDDAMIVIENGINYVCQDKVNGGRPRDTKGYEYGWQLTDSFEADGLSDLKKVEDNGYRRLTIEKKQNKNF
jgi:hypothetical protein